MVPGRRVEPRAAAESCGLSGPQHVGPGAITGDEEEEDGFQERQRTGRPGPSRRGRLQRRGRGEEGGDGHFPKRP
eukprot:4256051-Pyramimonas_sp.AAC.1